MKYISRIFILNFLCFTFFSCSSKESEVEEEIIEQLETSTLLDFTSDAQSQTLNVTSNISWNIEVSADWISLSETDGFNNGAINISVTTNDSFNSRYALFTINGVELSRTFTITQLGQELGPGVLDPNKSPSENFDLSTWKLNTPENNGSGFAKTISVSGINSGYQDDNYFYTGSDGGMVFKCPVDGYKTSANTSYTRVELREMLRGTNTSISTQGVNKNNWVFGSAPASDKNAAGGYDGEMTATLAINHVTTTGNSSHIGRVVIGQIHANSDEPIRIYYRKLKNNSLGAIYFAHEPTDGNGDEQWHEMIGSRSSSAANPSDGIGLNEKFTYTINVVGDILTVTISRDGKDDVVETVDMVNSGFNVGGQYMYFKAGIYHLNNSGNNDDYAQVTFYALEKTHTMN